MIKRTKKKNKKKIILIILVSILFLGGSWYFFDTFQKPISPEEEKVSMITGKKIAMIIAFKDFQDQEYFNSRQVFENHGAEIVNVSVSLGKASGTYGGEVDINKKLEEIEVKDFDAIVFIGGSGASNYIDNQQCYRIAKEAVAQDKILGAICIAPAILAKAGVLQGKKATVWTSSLDKSAAKILKDNGANYQDSDVVQDGKIITANGPAAAEKFGQAIASLLK